MGAALRSGHVGEGGAYIEITDDGRLNLFADDGTEIRSWGEGGGTKLKMQDDANLSLYPDVGKAVWASNIVVRGIGWAARWVGGRLRLATRNPSQSRARARTPLL